MEADLARDLPVPDLPFVKEPIDFAGKRVTVMGLGFFEGGAAVTRYLVGAGARLTLTDTKSAAELAEPLRRLAGFNFDAHLGGHRDEDFTDADVVLVNPAVKPTSPYLRLAAEAGVPLESETNIVFKRCRARIVGVTGSNGKSTTTKLVHDVLAAGDRRVWLGGNIGRPLVEHLDEIGPGDLVVVELSSFQLDHLARIGRGPSAAVVTNLAPNHLDWHGSMAAYTAAKRAILAALPPDGFAVLNADDAQVREWARATTRYFGLDAEAAHAGGRPGAFLKGGVLVWREGGAEVALPLVPGDIPLLGRHNVANVLAALAMGRLFGIDDRRAAAAVRAFAALPDRLELVLERGGVRYVNDSIATTPESAVCGLEAFDAPVVLIAGGYDKHVPLDGFAEAIARRARAVMATGATGPGLAALIEARRRGAEPAVAFHADFDQAVKAAVRTARPGDVVLLSPGCASYGQFRHYVERGRRFRHLVAALVNGDS